MQTNTIQSTCCSDALGIPENSLRYFPARCINCGMCLAVCPHAVFGAGETSVILLHPQDCIECGACQLNCPSSAISVNSGVGCAAAMINAALKGSSEVTCGCDSDSSCCC